MNYKFYGSDRANCKPINSKYLGIKDPNELYAILLNIWSKDTCAPRLRNKWTKENMTLGQCSITAFLVQDIFGGKVFGIKRNDGNYHCYNVIGNITFDLTSEQFGDEKLCYENNPQQYREIHFSKEEKFQRYILLKTNLEKFLKI